jgi:hypothetical protein
LQLLSITACLHSWKNLFQLGHRGLNGLAVALTWNGLSVASVVSIIHGHNHHARFGSDTTGNTKRLIQRPNLLGDLEFKFTGDHFKKKRGQRSENQPPCNPLSSRCAFRNGSDIFVAEAIGPKNVQPSTFDLQTGQASKSNFILIFGRAD